MKKVGHIFLQILPMIIVTLSSNVVNADRYYAFIKTTCDKKSHTVRISVPDLSGGEDPKDLIKNIRKGKIRDMYFFDDLATAHKKITCDLGNDHEVSFSVYQNKDHPRDDSIEIDIDRKPTPIRFQTLPMDAEIHVINLDDYTVKECSLWSSGSSKNEENCKVRHIVGNKLFGKQTQ